MNFIILLLISIAVIIGSSGVAHAVDIQIQDEKKIKELTIICRDNGGTFDGKACYIWLDAGDKIPEFTSESVYPINISYKIRGWMEQPKSNDEKIIERLVKIIELMEQQNNTKGG